jgi:hypothetical protein
MVNQHVDRRLASVPDPEGIRRRFFRMSMDENSVQEFLNEVGVWSTAEGQHTTDENGRLMRDDIPVGVPEMLLQGAFGHRWVWGRALPETVESMRAEQRHWRELMHSRAKLRKALAAAPPGNAMPTRKAAFALEAHFGNTLPVHLERRAEHTHAVVQPITGRELLIALAWLDLLDGAPCKVCQNCGVDYTRGGSKYCDSKCENARRQRKYRAGVKAKRTTEGTR